MKDSLRKKTKINFIIGSILFIFIQIVPVAFAGPIIDHNCTDLSLIPAQWIERAKNDLHIAYQHTSHGSQLITGMNALRGFPSFGATYDWDDTGARAGALDLDDNGIPGCADLSQGDWIDGNGVTPWVTATRNLLDNPANYHVNVIMWSWCSINGHNITRYLDNMEILVAEYSEGGSNPRAASYPVKFIFMTGHAEGQGESGFIYAANEQIRQHCINNNRILFDFANIESYDPDETYYYNRPMWDNLDYTDVSYRDSNWGIEWCSANTGSELEQLTSGNGVSGYSGCGHCSHSGSAGNSETINCVLKGRAAWWMFARLAGWNPDGGPVANYSGTPTNGTAPLEVSFTDTSTGEITGWSWDFDNNGTEDSTDQNPTHIYSVSGTFSVALEVTGSGGTDTETKINYITVTSPIQYDLTLNTVGSGSVTLDPAGGTYNAGTEVKLTPVPAAGWAFNGWNDDLSGYSNPVTIVMNSDMTVTATFDVDNDADGISDEEEDAGPNGGDGNNDNQPDSGQPNVATFHTQDGTNYVTLESPAGTTLSGCCAVSVPNEPGSPSGVNFPYGFIDFTINGVGAGGTTTLILYLPPGTNINTYWKYGPTPTNANPHWYEFTYESSTQTGAQINGNIITLYFIDGQRGDDDVTANGTIIDQGGPGTSGNSSGGSSDDGGGGGGCFVRTAYGK